MKICVIHAKINLAKHLNFKHESKSTHPLRSHDIAGGDDENATMTSFAASIKFPYAHSHTHATCSTVQNNNKQGQLVEGVLLAVVLMNAMMMMMEG